MFKAIQKAKKENVIYISSSENTVIISDEDMLKTIAYYEMKVIITMCEFM